MKKANHFHGIQTLYMYLQQFILVKKEAENGNQLSLFQKPYHEVRIYIGVSTGFAVSLVK